jgi:hypothetical protein
MPFNVHSTRTENPQPGNVSNRPTSIRGHPTAIQRSWNGQARNARGPSTARWGRGARRGGRRRAAAARHVMGQSYNGRVAGLRTMPRHVRAGVRDGGHARGCVACVCARACARFLCVWTDPARSTHEPSLTALLRQKDLGGSLDAVQCAPSSTLTGRGLARLQRGRRHVVAAAVAQLAGDAPR